MSCRFNPFIVTLLGICLAVSNLYAQAPHELGRQDKIQMYLDYLGRVIQLDPDKFSALLLEFELARSLGEIGTPHPEPLIGDFITRSTGKLHPRYARAVALFRDGKHEEARPLFERLASEKEIYLAAGARLHLAEIDGAAGRHESCLKHAEDVVQGRRVFLLDDYRACELMARAFRHIGKPLLESLQYQILLTDYRDVPEEVQTRAKARLAELQGKAGKPLSLVSNWMGAVERWIKEYETSADPTQGKQKDIHAGLEKLIELQMARERNT